MAVGPVEDEVREPNLQSRGCHGNTPILYPGICTEGLMRNGVNDSNHRGVWFYLHFLHPWAPGPTEIVVELGVRQSSVHKSEKHHMFIARPQMWTRLAT